MTSSLVAAYRKGAITADHLVVESLRLIDPEAPGLVLDPLPQELTVRMREFVRQYRAGRMVTNYGVLPTVDQVEAARRWIEENRRHGDTAFQPDDLARNGHAPGLPASEPGGQGPDHPASQPSGSGASRPG